jgi:hypothetical protein
MVVVTDGSTYESISCLRSAGKLEPAPPTNTMHAPLFSLAMPPTTCEYQTYVGADLVDLSYKEAIERIGCHARQDGQA